MSSNSAKNTGKSSKTARRSAKKGAKSAPKSARSTVKKTSKNARRTAGAGKGQRPLRSTAVRAHSVAPKGSSGSKSGSRMLRTPSPPVQPMAAHEIMVKAHKYRIGERVYYTSPTFGRAAATGSYTVVKLLPSESDDYQYRIKSSGEAFERVAKESQLDRA
jgi:hypothetical protein